MRIPELLISVREPCEVDGVLAGGATWIDLKEPGVGPLGAVSGEIAREIVRAVAGRGKISAALGELVDWPGASARRLLETPEIQVVKLGLSGCQARSDWQKLWSVAAHAVAAAGKRLAAVVYADALTARAPPADQVLDQARILGCRYVLLDTYDKQAGTLLEHMPPEQLRQIITRARGQGFQVALAGGLRLDTLPHLASLPVELIAVRGGVCGAGRSSRVQPTLVQQFCGALTEHWSAQPESQLDSLAE